MAVTTTEIIRRQRLLRARFFRRYGPLAMRAVPNDALEALHRLDTREHARWCRRWSRCAGECLALLRDLEPAS